MVFVYLAACPFPWCCHLMRGLFRGVIKQLLPFQKQKATRGIGYPRLGTLTSFDGSVGMSGVKAEKGRPLVAKINLT
jgi:hypothetical protein